MDLVNFYGAPVRLSSPYRTYLPGTDQNEVITGTDVADLIGQNGSDTLIGLGGDDTYGSVSMLSTIIEQVDGGIDTVYGFGDYILPQNVENLILVSGATAWGNASDNYMVGNDAFNVLNGKSGDDVLTGGGGADVFEFNAGSGHDLITDFQHGSDAVRLLGYAQFTRFSDVAAAMQQVGTDVILTLDGQDQIKFENTTVSDFSAADFKLGLDRSNLDLTFEDQFNALSLDDGQGSGTWRTQFDFGGDSNSIFARTLPANGEREYYSDLTTTGTGTTPIGINPFSIDGGALTISARPSSQAVQDVTYGLDFTSGVLTTYNSFAQQYGYFEAKIDVPEGTGAWPAFWLLPVDGSHPPELDVMENFGDENLVLTAHSREDGTYVANSERFADFDLSSGYHTFGMLWTESTITWYVDDVAIRTIATPDDAKRPMYMLLDLAVSSNAPDDFSADMKVGYVRAYALGSGFVDPLASFYTPPVVVAGPGVGDADVFAGTPGNDSYVVDNSNDQIIEQAGGGIDQVVSSVDYVLPDNVENLALGGTAVMGTGNTLNNTIIGNDLGNVLDGGTGRDTLKGGKGDDIYHVGLGTTVFEAGSEGYDTVLSTVNYVLAGNVEALTLSGSATSGMGNDLDNVIHGNDLGNSLSGLAGNDTLFGGTGADYLDGGAGTDQLSGGGGDDYYTIDTAGDLVVELPNGGHDAVWAYADYTLPANVEELWLFGTAVTGTGNDEANSLNGNELANTLDGQGGDDWIDGGAGADVMIGGAGNDSYNVDNAGDSVVEQAGGGTDTVWTSVGGVLADNAEVMMLAGAAVSAIGNAGDNRIMGNAGDNLIDGGQGADTLWGGAGADTFRLSADFGHDTILDFNVHTDSIDWSALKSQYAAPVLTQTSEGVLATFGNDSVTLAGTSIALVNAYQVFG